MTRDERDAVIADSREKIAAARAKYDAACKQYLDEFSRVQREQGQRQRDAEREFKESNPTPAYRRLV